MDFIVFIVSFLLAVTILSWVPILLDAYLRRRQR